jgi:3-oxoacyl-[acyl-carrier protein] reductase
VQRDTYLITGASSDIGCELIRQLAHAADASGGDSTTIVAHSNAGGEKLQALRKEFPNWAERLETLRADLAVESEVQTLVDAVRSTQGFPTHIVHLAAARPKLTRVTQIDSRSLDADLRIQVHSLSMLLRAFLPLMVQSGRRCKVVIMLSSVTLAAPKFMAQYVIAKYALLGLFRAVVAEYAEKPICINAVSPSMISTQFLENLPSKFVELAAAAHPAKRLATAADVVPSIRFLLSSNADYISGVNLPVTCGSVP